MKQLSTSTFATMQPRRSFSVKFRLSFFHHENDRDQPLISGVTETLSSWRSQELRSVNRVFVSRWLPCYSKTLVELTGIKVEPAKVFWGF